jgi:diguanylate cyclase (GGDEF)-like protein
LLYGSEAALQANTRRVLRLVGLTFVATLLLGLGVAFGLAQIQAVAPTVLYSWAGTICFYGLVRSGFSERFSEPSLAYAQLMFALSAVVISYGFISLARGAALELLCLLLAFAMDRLSSKQLLLAALGAVTMLALTSGGRIALHAGRINVSEEIFNLIMAAFLLPVAILVGDEIGRLHRRQASQGQLLSQTLNQLQDLATRDALTGLTNRRQMQSLLEQQQQLQQSGGATFSVALLDIDWFKAVNDTHGHSTGDVVLHTFGALVASSLGLGSTVARWGGEEFLVLLRDCTEAQARDALDPVFGSVRAYEWSNLAPALKVTFSAGACEHRAGSQLTDTLGDADKALYLAKALGRDCAVYGRSPEIETLSHVGAHDRVAQCRPNPSDSPDEAPLRSQASRMERTRLQDCVAATSSAAAAAGEATSPSRRLLNAFITLIMSPSPDIQEYLRLPLIACGLHAIWIAAVQWYAIPAGAIGAIQGHLVLMYEIVCAVGFYSVIRCGWSRRFDDGGMIVQQMLAASAVACYGYVVAPSLRPSLLHLLCVIQVFGMATLKPRASRIAGLGAIGALFFVLMVLVLTGAEDTHEELLKLALACFILFRLSTLSRGYSEVRREVAKDKAQLEVLVAQVQEQIIRDTLTGLFNRRHMQDLLVLEYENFDRTGLQFCVALIDLDHFKRINDQLGHQTGDQVLMALADISRKALRENDVLCRWGGEEFLLLMRDTYPASSGLVALGRLRDGLKTVEARGDAGALSVTFSAGVASVRRSEEVAHLLERMDKALYSAKEQGRDRDVVASDADSEYSAGDERAICTATAFSERSTLLAPIGCVQGSR